MSLSIFLIAQDENTHDKIVQFCVLRHLSWSSLIPNFSWLLLQFHLDLHMSSSQGALLHLSPELHPLFPACSACLFPGVLHHFCQSASFYNFMRKCCFATFSRCCWCHLWIVLTFKILYLLLGMTASTSGSPSEGFSLLICGRACHYTDNDGTAFQSHGKGWLKCMFSCLLRFSED